MNVPAIKASAEFSVGQNPVSNTPHYNFSGGYAYLKENFSEGDVVVSDQIHKYDYVFDRYLRDAAIINPKLYSEELISWEELLNGVESGWVVKSNNNGMLLPGFVFDDFEMEGYSFDFRGVFNRNVAIWWWTKN